jgi:hypothetical protein
MKKEKVKFVFPTKQLTWKELADEKEAPPNNMILPALGKYVHSTGHVYRTGDAGIGGYPPIYNPITKRWNVQHRPGIFKKRDPEKNLFARMQQTEEGRTLWKLWVSKNKIKGQTPGRRKGNISGYSKAQLGIRKAKVKSEAKEIVKLMEAKGFEIPKAEFARESIETAVEIMRYTEISPRDKLAAARTVLEWTLAKPVAQSEISVKRAEDFLSMVTIAEESVEKEIE